MSGGEPHILQQKTIVGEFTWFTENLKIQYLVWLLVQQ